MPYIKSHSNYVLKKEHQRVKDGTVYERDMTTIGGINQFAPGQTPIYKSGNFIITVRNDGKVANEFNKGKWKEGIDGDVWTLETVNAMSSEFEDQNDTKIVLKQDYYDFRDFAYYGSLTEMFRASITDILSRFPGELYVTNENAYYTTGQTVDLESIKDRVLLGNDSLKYVDNPFGIDIHSKKKPLDGKPIKYFADGGYENYEIITEGSESGTDITNWVVSYENKFCKGEKTATISINGITIEAWVGDNNEVIYLTSASNGLHIRPKEEYIAYFYNACDNFQKIILDRKTTPKYKSIFSVIKDSPNGYYRKMEEFIFPTTYGGYNIDATSFGFNDFTVRLSEIGHFYDEFFTDNLYRSLTHEAIKNFDWSYTREYLKGDEEDFIQGGQKIQKALRVFAREFDEILSYIDNIKNLNKVTYDGRGNLPDYFLIDEAENKGWDVKLVYPYELTEYDIKDGKTEFTDYIENTQLSGGGVTFIRQFSQDTSTEVYPYSSSKLDWQHGYFIDWCNGQVPCYYEGTTYGYVTAEGSGTTYVDSSGQVRNRVKSYSDEKGYTYMDINNEFMRRLIINSNHIFRHKGTIEGIEMLLALFGLKSKRWVERQTPSCMNSSTAEYSCACTLIDGPSVIPSDGAVAAYTAFESQEGKSSTVGASNTEIDSSMFDYEIIEYSSFADRIEEKWDAVHQMYRIDWINSTKAIVYDNRSSSNYTKYGAQDDYETYQGLPVSWRYDESDNPYIKVSSIKNQEFTDKDSEAFKNVNDKNNPVRRRFLYPNFDKYTQLDGNPYFQMNGGWLGNTVENDGSDAYNFQFDADDNIAWTCYIPEGDDTNEDIKDNHPIHKETVRNIRRVDSIGDLLTIPYGTLMDGTVVSVTNVNKDFAILNGSVYTIHYEFKDKASDPYRYVSLTKNDSYIQIGNDRFFNDTIIVYDKEYDETTYLVSDKEYGYEVKAYIKDDDDFICKADEEGNYSIDSFMIFKADVGEEYTNYFIIDDSYYSNRMENVDKNGIGNRMGWRRLKKTDPEYIRINTITNYYEGNNAHNGNMVYDNGHEYFTYFKRLFKHAIDNDLFDDRCYEAFYYDLDNEIQDYGFSGLVHTNEMVKQYQPYMLVDSKIHYFGNYYKRASGDSATTCEEVMVYGDETSWLSGMTDFYSGMNPSITTNEYILNDDENMILGTPYTSTTADMVTDQVVNNKRLTIKFYLHHLTDSGGTALNDIDSWSANVGQCEIKYLDDIVMNYLTQMIPSTTIVDVKYVYKSASSS